MNKEIQELVRPEIDLPIIEPGGGNVSSLIREFSSSGYFKIIGLLNSSDEELSGIKSTRTYDDFKEIRQDGTFTKASGRKANGNPVINGKSCSGNYYVNEDTKECVFSTYARILIQRIK